MYLLLALSVILPLALGQDINLKPYDTTARAMFYVSDANKDGVLTLNEIIQNFRSYDTNNDGLVTRYEYTSYVDTHSPQLHKLSHGLYDVYDVDKDDVLDLHDFENFHRLLDGDGDGFVVEHEYVRYMAIILEALDE